MTERSGRSARLGRRTSPLTSQSLQEDNIATQAYPALQKSSSLPPANASADGSETEADILEPESTSQSQHSQSSASTRASSSTSSGSKRSAASSANTIQRVRARLCTEFGFCESDFPATSQPARSFSPEWLRRAFRAYKMLSQGKKAPASEKVPLLMLPYAEEWQKEHGDSLGSPDSLSHGTAPAPSSVLSDISDLPAPTSVSFSPTAKQSPSLLSPTSGSGRRRTLPNPRHAPKLVAEDNDQDILISPGDSDKRRRELCDKRVSANSPCEEQAMPMPFSQSAPLDAESDEEKLNDPRQDLKVTLGLGRSNETIAKHDKENEEDEDDVPQTQRPLPLPLSQEPVTAPPAKSTSPAPQSPAPASPPRLSPLPSARPASQASFLSQSRSAILFSVSPVKPAKPAASATRASESISSSALDAPSAELLSRFPSVPITQEPSMRETEPPAPPSEIRNEDRAQPSLSIDTPPLAVQLSERQASEASDTATNSIQPKKRRRKRRRKTQPFGGVFQPQEPAPQPPREDGELESESVPLPPPPSVAAPTKPFACPFQGCCKRFATAVELTSHRKALNHNVIVPPAAALAVFTSLPPPHVPLPPPIYLPPVPILMPVQLPLLPPPHPPAVPPPSVVFTEQQQQKPETARSLQQEGASADPAVSFAEPKPTDDQSEPSERILRNLSNGSLSEDSQPQRVSGRVRRRPAKYADLDNELEEFDRSQRRMRIAGPTPAPPTPLERTGSSGTEDNAPSQATLSHGASSSPNASSQSTATKKSRKGKKKDEDSTKSAERDPQPKRPASESEGGISSLTDDNITSPPRGDLGAPPSVMPTNVPDRLISDDIERPRANDAPASQPTPSPAVGASPCAVKLPRAKREKRDENESTEDRVRRILTSAGWTEKELRLPQVSLKDKERHVPLVRATLAAATHLKGSELREIVGITPRKIAQWRSIDVAIAPLARLWTPADGPFAPSFEEYPPPAQAKLTGRSKAITAAPPPPCTMCKTKFATVLCYPCTHVNLCEECGAANPTACPECRVTVTSVLCRRKLFLPPV